MKTVLLVTTVLALSTSAFADNKLQGLSDASGASSAALSQAAEQSKDASIKLSGEGLRALETSLVKTSNAVDKYGRAFIVKGIEISKEAGHASKAASKEAGNMSVTLITNIGEFSADLSESTVRKIQASLNASGEVVVEISTAANQAIKDASKAFGPSLRASRDASVDLAVGILKVGEKLVMVPVELIKELHQAARN